MKKLLFLAAAFCFSFQMGSAQISSVDYSLQYNSETCLFDCYMVVNQGETQKTLDRAQFNSQITIVAPVTSNVYVTKSYMPLVSNQTKSSATPADWSVSNEIEGPRSLEDYRLVSIVPELLPAAFYNDVKAGDKVKLFSVKVTHLANCAKDVRLYDNNTDPGSIEKGMAGSDFRNGFTVGGYEQKYNTNAPTVYPAGPEIKNIDFSMRNGISLDVELAAANSACQRSVSYSIEAPNGELVDYNTFTSMKSSDILRGAYKVIASDDLGCKSEAIFTPLNASSNQTVLENENELAVEFNSGVYPNPAQNTFALTIEGAIGTKVTGEMIDLEGKVVMKNAVNTKLTSATEVINIQSDLVPGMYNLSLTVDNKESVNHKILIIK